MTVFFYCSGQHLRQSFILVLEKGAEGAEQRQGIPAVLKQCRKCLYAVGFPQIPHPAQNIFIQQFLFLPVKQCAVPFPYLLLSQKTFHGPDCTEWRLPVQKFFQGRFPCTGYPGIQRIEIAGFLPRHIAFRKKGQHGKKTEIFRHGAVFLRQKRHDAMTQIRTVQLSPY